MRLIPTPKFSGMLTPQRLALAVLGPWVTTECMFCRKCIFDRIGTFDTQYRISSDLDFKFRALRQGRGIHVLPAFILRKVIHGGSVSQKHYLQSLPEIGGIIWKNGFRMEASMFLARCYAFEVCCQFLPRRWMEALKTQVANSLLHMVRRM